MPYSLYRMQHSECVLVSLHLCKWLGFSFLNLLDQSSNINLKFYSSTSLQALQFAGIKYEIWE